MGILGAHHPTYAKFLAVSARFCNLMLLACKWNGRHQMWRIGLSGLLISDHFLQVFVNHYYIFNTISIIKMGFTSLDSKFVNMRFIQQSMQYYRPKNNMRTVISLFSMFGLIFTVFGIIFLVDSNSLLLEEFTHKNSNTNIRNIVSLRSLNKQKPIFVYY